MPFHPRIARLGQALLKQGAIDQQQLALVLSRAEAWNMRLGKVLTTMRLMRDSAVVQAIAQATGFPIIDLTTTPPDAGASQLLEEAFCVERGVFPLALREKNGIRTLFLAMADPTDVEAMDLAAARCRGRVKPFVLSEALIERAIDRFYRGLDIPLEVQDEAALGELDELKIVDASNRTMSGVQAPVINLKEAEAPERTMPPGSLSPAERMALRFGGSGGASPPAPLPARAPAPGRAPAPQADPLADILSGLGSSSAPAPASSSSQLAALEARLERLEQSVAAVLKAQETTTSLARALTEILIERRLLTAEDLRSRVGRR